jgi:hypothetical protein
MTRNRTQLDSSRTAYRTARYPGDLAAELLPQPSVLARTLSDRRWILFGGVGATAAAAALILSLLLSRATDLPQPFPTHSADRGGLVDWLPIAPDRMPLPHFQPPALPLSPPELRLDLQIPAGVERYQDLAMQYRQLPVPAPLESIRHSTVPTIPTDLPARSVEWFQKVWTGEKSA